MIGFCNFIDFEIINGVASEYIWKVKRSAGVVVHTVRIRQATMDDDGDYACESRNQRANQIVHVNSRFIHAFVSE